MSVTNGPYISNSKGHSRPKSKRRYREVAKKKLPKGKTKRKQRGSAVSVRGYSYKRKGKTVRVKGYRRGKPGGKRG